MGPNEVLDKSVVLTAPIPEFHAAVLSGVEEGSPVEAIGDAWVGIVQEGTDELDITRGRHVRIRIMGISTCVAAGEIGVGDTVTLAADGRVVTAPAESPGTTVGMALTAATEEGDYISVLLRA